MSSQATSSQPTIAVDGRRKRGDASREAILRAATEVIVSDGVAALTHRRVSEVEGVSLARVSYHYPKVDDLLVAATTSYLERFDSSLREMAARSMVEGEPIAEACTGFLFELVTDSDDEFLAMVEVRLALHRTGRAIDDTDVLEVIRAFGADEERAMSIVAALFGFAVLAATTPMPVAREQVRTYVEMILGEDR